MKQVMSQKDFKYYKDRVNHWKRVFGLNDWDIVVKMVDLKEEGVGAFARADHVSRLAEIGLTQKLDPDACRPYNNTTLDQWALHEVLHVFFTEMRWYTVHNEKEKIESIEHGMIRTLENIILGDDR